ncbi:MAG: hypothetical protein COB24_13950 [Hyphomicrobiales bacterium]|nr:MAG: hypothetical protein COB24_13950 [Hyphomicrobiales bacterium]
MSKNYRLVEYFVSEFYRDKPQELEHIVSPTFVFKSPVSGELNFAQYVECVLSYFENSEINIDNISSKDDVGFVVDSTTELKNNTAAYGQKISNKVKIVVKNDLIEVVEYGFATLEAEIIEFK